MKYETKIQKWKFTDIWEEMVQSDYELVYFSEIHLVSFWKRKIKQKVVKTKPLIDDTILYQEHRDSWKAWGELLKAKYKEFRHARYETHKDYVSPLWEKKLLNIINKYPQRIGIALLESSLTYKSIVEKQDVIDREMKVIQEENKKQSEILQKKEDEKHKEEVSTAKEERRKKIEASWYPERYWIDKAKEKLRQQWYKEEFMWPMIPTTINKLLWNQ